MCPNLPTCPHLHKEKELHWLFQASSGSEDSREEAFQDRGGQMEGGSVGGQDRQVCQIQTLPSRQLGAASGCFCLPRLRPPLEMAQVDPLELLLPCCGEGDETSLPSSSRQQSQCLCWMQCKYVSLFIPEQVWIALSEHNTNFYCLLGVTNM